MLILIRLESCKSAARFKYIWRVSTDVMRLLYICAPCCNHRLCPLLTIRTSFKAAKVHLLFTVYD